MTKNSSAKEQIQKILDDYGGKTATQAPNLLLKDPTLKELKPGLEFISKNWRDPLRPALIKLACESVGGKPEETDEVAVAMSLMNLSFYLWDDLLDQAPIRLFRPTFFGKFGKAQTLILGGLVSAKAFTILNQTLLDQAKKGAISRLFWNMWTKMAETETLNLRHRNGEYSAKDKLFKIETEAAANLQACLKIGALMGNGSEEEILHLGKYGFYLGVILELQIDVQVSLNLTLELIDKIRSGGYPYTLLWAKEHNLDLQRELQDSLKLKTIGPATTEKIVVGVLESKVLDEIEKKIQTLTKKGTKELQTIKKNSAITALRIIVEAQPQLFKEGLCI